LVVDLKGIKGSVGSPFRDSDAIPEDDRRDQVGSHSPEWAIEDVRVGKDAPVLAECASRVGSWQIRNRGSVAGNICNCSPCADTAPALMVLEAIIEVASLKGTSGSPSSSSPGDRASPRSNRVRW